MKCWLKHSLILLQSNTRCCSKWNWTLSYRPRLESDMIISDSIENQFVLMKHIRVEDYLFCMIWSNLTYSWWVTVLSRGQTHLCMTYLITLTLQSSSRDDANCNAPIRSFHIRRLYTKEFIKESLVYLVLRDSIILASYLTTYCTTDAYIESFKDLCFSIYLSIYFIVCLLYRTSRDFIKRTLYWPSPLSRVSGNVFGGVRRLRIHPARVGYNF